MSAYRIAVVLLWALAILNSVIARGLFWDGASFLTHLLDFRTFHDFYPAREHVAWLTQAPVLLAADLGLRDTRLLAIVYSATLFVWPTGLYHLALHRVRSDPALTAAVVTIIAIVYLPTSFFIVGEYNIAYAATTATMVIALTGVSRRDGVLLCALGALSIASYEAMIYLGPLLAIVLLWARRAKAGAIDDITRLLMLIAALAFLGGAVVALAAIVTYWDHAYFREVRGAAFHFWQNMQFLVPLVGLGILTLVSLVWPGWLRSRGPVVWLGVVAVLLLATPLQRQLDPEAMLFPPSHYIARTAAGWLLAAILVAMWLYAGWHQDRPKLLTLLARPEIARRLLGALTAVMLAAAVPDLVLDRLWFGYLDYFRGLVTDNTGVVRANDLPMRQWPQRLFSQPWTYPALSMLLHDTPGQGLVLIDKDYHTTLPFDPSCGTIPRLEGFAWR